MAASDLGWKNQLASATRGRRWTSETLPQVALFFEFENLVLGAEHDPVSQANPVPPDALTRLCREYGNASIRRAYADWSNQIFGRHQQNLALNGIDLIQISRFGVRQKNAADVRMAVDAMETLITHPNIDVFVLVAGDGDYTPLVQRLREFGKWVVGVGTEASASDRLVSVCSQYTYWGTLVAEVDPSAPAGVEAAFDISAAEHLLRAAMSQATRSEPTAGWLKNKMLTLDPAFDERNYGCENFRAFLNRMSHLVEIAGTSGLDITVRPATGPAAVPDAPADMAGRIGEQ